MDIFLSGFHSPNLAILLLRCLLGTFFLLARFRWIWDPSQGASCPVRPQWFPQQRHDSLRNKLQHCGYSRDPLLAGVVAVVEISAALGVIFGLLTVLSAIGLLSVLIFATICTAKEKVARQSPIDCIDCVCCYLWLVEPLYLVMAVTLLLTGAGSFSLDHLLFGV